MRTISTLCATGAGISIASIGLAVVREESAYTSSNDDSSRNPSPANLEMTAVAAYPHSSFTSSPFAVTAPPSARSFSEGLNGKTRSSSAKVGQKRTFTPRASFSVGTERPMERQRRDESASPAAIPDTQPRSWIRRLSSGLSTSRDSTTSPVSRPGSAAISHSNGSIAFSQAGSTTPMLSSNTPPPLPPNKLVKRSSSLRSSNGSPLTSSGSKLPVPVFRRPATSHQRSVTQQGLYAASDTSDHMSVDEKASSARDLRHVHYFTPRVHSDEVSYTRRRSSTGIPTPIQRIYPDRKYTPLLVAASKDIRQARREVDEGLSDEDESAVPRLTIAPGYASSPLLQHENSFEQGQTPRRSFSIGDLLSTGPQPLWKRPSISRGKTTGSKIVRRSRPRVVSEPHSEMGGVFSRKTDADSERPAKRRDTSDPTPARSSIHTSAPGTVPSITPTQEVDLRLSTTTPHSLYSQAENFPFTDIAQTQTSSPLGEQRLPSTSYYSATVRQVRVSGTQSEVPSTVGSESEDRSVGDASTDWHSDTVYDSYPTRTTRSSSGKRGPHIGTIFDDSPPNPSNGRSTRLTDLLNGEGPMSHDEHVSRYRGSIIEEEESVMSTPVRSMHDRSVASTPSARNEQQHFTSSPPVMPATTDLDDIDWDPPEDEPSEGHFTFHMPSSTQIVANGNQMSLPFRFGSALPNQHPGMPASTPARSNGALSDRANLFEWAEVQPSPSANASPPRPRTVHGKKDQEARGSRSAGRRAPSGMHARSHSVPVVPDTEGKRSNVIANKFGTWGVGSKAVTEEWNEDFEFDESPLPISEQAQQDERRVDSGHVVFVPKSIREQQESVMRNINLLREWGILIEELKELRVRAVGLEMLHGRYAQAWQGVDAMIELADQESEEQSLQPRQSPPSSPGFDYNDFEEWRPSIGEAANSRQDAGIVESPIQDPQAVMGAFADVRPSTPRDIIIVRPRKDSEAVARSVIEAIQSKRSVSEPTSLEPLHDAKKLPFDTDTLRHIVPYVRDLKRQIKDALRETEGLYSSPRRRSPRGAGDHGNDDEEPAFRKMFDSAEDDNEAKRRRREQARTDHDGTS